MSQVVQEMWTNRGEIGNAMKRALLSLTSKKVQRAKRFSAERLQAAKERWEGKGWGLTGPLRGTAPSRGNRFLGAGVHLAYRQMGKSVRQNMPKGLRF